MVRHNLSGADVRVGVSKREISQKLSKYFRFVFESGSSRGQAQASYTRSAEASKRCITRATALALIAALFFPSCRRMLSIAQDLRPRRPAASLHLPLSTGARL